MPTRIGTTNRLKGKQLMKLSHFFIDRPIFGIVISIVTVLLGAIAYLDYVILNRLSALRLA